MRTAIYRLLAIRTAIFVLACPIGCWINIRLLPSSKVLNFLHGPNYISYLFIVNVQYQLYYIKTHRFFNQINFFINFYCRQILQDFSTLFMIFIDDFIVFSQINLLSLVLILIFPLTVERFIHEPLAQEAGTGQPLPTSSTINKVHSFKSNDHKIQSF